VAKGKILIPEPERVFTPVFNRLYESKTRFVVNMGGTGSSKSFSAAQKEVLIAASDRTNTLVIRKVAATLRDSVIPSFRNRINEFGLNKFFEENKTDRVIRCAVTGSQIIFRGLDDPEKLKSIEGIKRILVEEASELNIEDLFELNRRARGIENIQITLCFNPIHEEHWIKKHFFDQKLEDCTIIHSTYKDNPFLTDTDREQIEWLKAFNENQYRIYALGEWGLTEAGTPWLYSFDMQKHVREDLPFMDKYPVYLSFDFNNDPFACVAFQMSPNKGTKGCFAHAIKEFSDTIKVGDMCQRIKAIFPYSILYVTGDRSGQNEDVGRNQTLYQIIAGLLNLSNKQLNLNTHNLEHADSRMLLNTMLYSYPDMLISKKGCPELVRQCAKAKVDEDSATPSKLYKDRGKGYKMDEFDAWRYFYQTYFNQYAKDTYFKAIKR
jgi:phage terminase large subunit